MEAYRALGHEAWLAVGHKREEDSSTFAIPNDLHRNALVRGMDAFERVLGTRMRRVRGLGRLTALIRRLGEAPRTIAIEMGREDFGFPGTALLLGLPPRAPDIVHCHNLHGGYFDLRFLPRLSRQVPTVLNVHDGWLMSGHCAFSLECERWKSGCGACPDLSLFPSIKRDATAFNWQRKRSILARSRLYVATPSEWMMARVRESIISPAAVQTRTIPNGVDTRTFCPGNRTTARAEIGVDKRALVLLVAANGLRHNVWKDYKTLRSAIEILGTRSWPKPVMVIAVGDVAPTERAGSVELRFVPFQSDSALLARYYRAADVYLHAARVESFGNVLLEARASGIAIVATSVGGIPEQVRALNCEWAPDGLACHNIDHATGVLVRAADPLALAGAVRMLLEDPRMREGIAANGLRQVQAEFTATLQAERFLSWYREIVDAFPE